MSRSILFLHGWGMSAAVYDDVITALGDDYNCRAPDFPGHGRAYDLAAPDGLQSCVNVMKDTLAELDHPIVVGWSMGAAVVWRYVAQHGTSALGGLVTVDMSPCVMEAEGWSDGLLGRDKATIIGTTQVMRDDWEFAVARTTKNMFAPDIDCPPLIEKASNIMGKNNKETLLNIWQDLIQVDERKTLAQIDIPSLVCFGGKSQLYPPRIFDWIVAQSYGAQTVCFEHSGHSPNLEEPQKFIDTIRAFAQSCGESSKESER